MKVLLKAYFDNKLWDLNGFVDLILGQPTVGTVIKIENDDDDGVYSVVTTLNLGRYNLNNADKLGMGNFQLNNTTKDNQNVSHNNDQGNMKLWEEEKQDTHSVCEVWPPQFPPPGRCSACAYPTTYKRTL
ncbi:hypothetical protein CASFOL_009138 [Castilleja foliolosa]|uniref:Uncharacterized protein n=1 Tax=Castilleja foliolosa TaxID=1961234 RepID=A0ABD3DYU8_9LAMI